MVLWDAEGFFVWVGCLLKIADFLLEIFNRLIPLDDCVLCVFYDLLLLGDYILNVLNILVLLGHRRWRLDHCFNLLKLLVFLLLTVNIGIEEGSMINIPEWSYLSRTLTPYWRPNSDP